MHPLALFLTGYLTVVVPYAVYVVAVKVGDRRIDDARSILGVVAFAPSTPPSFAPVWLRVNDAVMAWHERPGVGTYKAAMRAIREAETWLGLAANEASNTKR